jgi:hypothetical protein
VWGCFGSLDIVVYEEIKIANKFARGGKFLQFFGPELALGVSRQNIREKIKCWVDNQHMTLWWGLITT